MAIQITRLTGNDDGTMIAVPIADGTNVDLQSIYNAVRTFEAVPENMDVRPLCIASGKQPLGGGRAVAITMQLINKSTIEFEARAGPAVIGCSVDGGNLVANLTWDGAKTDLAVDAFVLTDTNATFATNGIQSGAVVRNITDGSSATVATVDSETQITCTALTGGGTNNWSQFDVWEVDSGHPFSPTAYTHIGYAQDTAASTIEVDSSPQQAFLNVVYDGANLKFNIWGRRGTNDVLSPTSCNVSWRNPSGTELFSQSNTSPADALGHFSFVVAQSLAGNTSYYAVVTVTDAIGSIVTHVGVPSIGT